jgi:putative endonuclease
MKRKMSHIAVGNVGEEIATKWLQRRGFLLLHRNYRISGGELDVVMQKDGVVHCFEVKTQTYNRAWPKEGSDIHRPEDHYTPKKHRMVRYTFEKYLQKMHGGLDIPHALHVVCVDLHVPTKQARVRVIWNV